MHPIEAVPIVLLFLGEHLIDRFTADVGHGDLRRVLLHAFHRVLQQIGFAFREGGEVTVGEAGDAQGVTRSHFEMDADGGIRAPEREDHAFQVEHAAAERHFAEQESIRGFLNRHVLQVHADRIGRERFDRAVRFFEQCDVVAGVDECTDPLTADRLEVCDEFIGGVVLMILEGEFQAVLSQGGLDELQSASAVLGEGVEGGKRAEHFVTPTAREDCPRNQCTGFSRLAHFGLERVQIGLGLGKSDFTLIAGPCPLYEVTDRLWFDVAQGTLDPLCTEFPRVMEKSHCIDGCLEPEPLMTGEGANA